jgi:hypothetical protein
MTLAVGNLSNQLPVPFTLLLIPPKKTNCADEEGAAIPSTAKAPAATSPHNNNHLHNTLLLQLQINRICVNGWVKQCEALVNKLD